MRFLLLPCLFVVPLAAQVPPLVTDRPDQTESARTVPAGTVQIEVGGVTEPDLVTVGGTLLRFGLARRVELRLGFAGWHRLEPGARGVGDLDAGFKVALLPGGGPVRVALLGTLTVPTGSEAFTADQLEPAGRVAVGMDLSDRLSAGVNVGAARAGTRAEGFYSLVLGFGVTDGVGAFAEGFGTVPTVAGGPAAHAVDGGITLLLTPVLQLDSSVGLGLHGAASEWFVGVGLSLRLPG